MTNVLIAGYYGLGNIGDEAILAGMVTSLRKYIDDPHVSVITNNLEETRTLHNVRPVRQSFKKGVLRFIGRTILEGELAAIQREIRNCDIFILGGGSLLQDLRVYYLPALLSLVRLAQRYGKKTVIYGIGAGPIDTHLDRKLCSSILNEADLVTVRDSMSKEVLERCGVRDVIRTADPAFGIEVPDPTVIGTYLTSLNITNGDRYIASTAYNWLHDSDLSRNAVEAAQDLRDRRESLAGIFESIVREHDQRMLLVPTVKVDREGYAAIRDLMPSSEKADVLEYNPHFTAVFAALSRADVLVGMRLHSLILATMMGVPVVPISYCGKVKSYLELVGLEGFYLDVEDLGTETFAGQFCKNFETVWENRALYAAKQRQAAEVLRERTLLNARLVAELIG
ncbi:polysaccharide pyruvyl transferase family protein [Methanoculleus submarinus]|uniref:Polysaccharide pyruvyl transferase family protein n=1 Tax=Methanoculleus submarinus TaxID=204050 RepID=A0AAX3EBZ0_9EURY|nr:polysaccharide pyruvyl transferase family protein [Methanoculleus submarinus]UYU19687.1 polysaccharide pyruvyl transferase family protein [Methanoculleus submarinus]